MSCSNLNLYFVVILGQGPFQGHVLSYIVSRCFEFPLLWCLRCIIALHDLAACRCQCWYDLGVLDLNQTNQLGDFLGRLCWRGSATCRCMSRRCGQDQTSNTDRHDILYFFFTSYISQDIGNSVHFRQFSA